ncbi:MAG: lipocalin family protein [Rudaea sp.]|nr:lipocalin family protein [Rudaea sp.]
MKLRRVIVSLALWFGVAAMLYACADEGTGDMPELTTSAKIDLQRYMGTWYVIANIPYFAERGKMASRDVYRLDADGNVETTYVYRKSFDGPEKTTGSLGIVQPGSDNARWIVRFLWLIHADYLVLEVAPDYSWVLVGQPNRKLGWVLARNPAMEDALYTTLLSKLHGFGYDIAKFMRVPQFKEQVGQPGFQ